MNDAYVKEKHFGSVERSLYKAKTEEEECIRWANGGAIRLASAGWQKRRRPHGCSRPAC